MGIVFGLLIGVNFSILFGLLFVKAMLEGIEHKLDELLKYRQQIDLDGRYGGRNVLKMIRETREKIDNKERK